MKLLITGGAGFLGSNLALHGAEKGYEIMVLDNLSRVGSDQNLENLIKQKNIKFENIDLRDSKNLLKSISNFKPDAVFHLSGQVAMTTSINDPRYDLEINLMGTFNLLESLRTLGMKIPIIYSSTNKVYGDLEQFTYKKSNTRYTCIEYPNGFDEKITLDFHSPYGCSKGAAEQYILDYCRLFGIKSVIFRHSSMYGPSQHSTFDQGWVGWFCKQFLLLKENKIKEISISGNGFQVRDLLFSSDVANLYYDALDAIDAVSGNAFNIGGGIENSLSLIELFSFLNQEIGTEYSLQKNKPRFSDQKFFVADINKINKHINWKPLVSYQDGLRMALSWIQNKK